MFQAKKILKKLGFNLTGSNWAGKNLGESALIWPNSAIIKTLFTSLKFSKILMQVFLVNWRTTVGILIVHVLRPQSWGSKSGSGDENMLKWFQKSVATLQWLTFKWSPNYQRSCRRTKFWGKCHFSDHANVARRFLIEVWNKKIKQ